MEPWTTNCTAAGVGGGWADVFVCNVNAIASCVWGGQTRGRQLQEARPDEMWMAGGGRMLAAAQGSRHPINIHTRSHTAHPHTRESQEQCHHNLQPGGKLALIW